jgi:hypothetical protein
MFGHCGGIGAEIVEQEFEIGAGVARRARNGKQALLLHDLRNAGRRIDAAEAEIGAGDPDGDRIVVVFGELDGHGQRGAFEQEAGRYGDAQSLADVVARTTGGGFGHDGIADQQFDRWWLFWHGQIKHPAADALRGVYQIDEAAIGYRTCSREAGPDNVCGQRCSPKP